MRFAIPQVFFFVIELKINKFVQIIHLNTVHQDDQTLNSEFISLYKSPP